jgi:hypothetical protein
MRFKMISKVSAGTVLGLAVLTFVALRVNTTGFYERTFNASPDKLWRIWNDPDAIEKWRGPRHYTAPIIRNDPRIGRTYLWSMKSPEGEMSWTTGVYKKVLPNVRIVSTYVVCRCYRQTDSRVESTGPRSLAERNSNGDRLHSVGRENKGHSN